MTKEYFIQTTHVSTVITLKRRSNPLTNYHSFSTQELSTTTTTTTKYFSWIEGLYIFLLACVLPKEVIRNISSLFVLIFLLPLILLFWSFILSWMNRAASRSPKGKWLLP